METKTPALERLLEALSPALTAEIDRVAREATDGLEQDFQRRIEAAVRETETTLTANAAAELERAVAEARDASRKEVTEELETRLKNSLENQEQGLRTTHEETLIQLKNSLEVREQNLKARYEETLSRLNAEVTAERERLQQQLCQWRTFAEAQRVLAESSSQPEMLARFLKLTDPFASALALYVTKADGLALWKHRGKTAFPEIISEETTDPETYFRTISVRGKTVAAVCAAPPFKAEALDFLGSTMEQAIEFYGLRLRAPATKPAEAFRTAGATTSGAQQPAAPDVSQNDPKLHAEARRAARLLISEIKLYHEDELRSGRQQSDIYQRLRKEIDQGREMYKHRVAGAVLASRDYFHEELVRILGENDASRLGGAYPGPMSS